MYFSLYLQKFYKSIEMKKIKAIIFAGCILCSISIFAQTKICFGYDDASGNRTSRIICIKSAPVNPDSVAIEQPVTESLGEMVITFFPNPTQGQLTVSITNLPSGIQGEITLYDLSGKLLFKQSTIQETTHLDFSSQSIGMYILGIHAGDKSREWKVIKQ